MVINPQSPFGDSSFSKEPLFKCGIDCSACGGRKLTCTKSTGMSGAHMGAPLRGMTQADMYEKHRYVGRTHGCAPTGYDRSYMYERHSIMRNAECGIDRTK